MTDASHIANAKGLPEGFWEEVSEREAIMLDGNPTLQPGDAHYLAYWLVYCSRVDHSSRVYLEACPRHGIPPG